MKQKIFKGAKVFFMGAFLTLLVSTSSNNLVKVSNSNMNLTLDLSSMAQKIEENIKNDLYSAKDSYTGYLTGYAADCPLCTGRLACMPNLDVLNGNVTYVDDTYGELNIVASSTFIPCGTVVRINDFKNANGPLYAIVLDRGVGRNNLDLLTVSEDYAYQYVGRSIVNYDILRKGWANPTE